MDTRLDAIDVELLAALQEDARTPQASLGARVGLSAAAVNRRIRRLVDAGVISGITAVLAPEKLGHPLTVIAEVAVETEQGDLLQRTELVFTKCPQVQQCYFVTGEWDFVLIFLVKDMDEYTALTRELFTAKNNVKRSRTSVAMSRSKVSLKIPIRGGERP